MKQNYKYRGMDGYHISQMKDLKGKKKKKHYEIGKSNIMPLIQ